MGETTKDLTKSSSHSSKYCIVFESDDKILRTPVEIKLAGTEIRAFFNAKKMPERKPVNFMNYWFNQGYNACLNEILGEEE